MKLRFHQTNIHRRRYVPPSFRHEGGWYVNEVTQGPKVLQAFNESTQEWETIPLVVEDINEMNKEVA